MNGLQRLLVMSQPNPLQPVLKSLLTALRTHLWLWLAPTVTIAGFAALYGLVKPDVWQAAQALVVRDEALGSSQQGRFDSTDAMRAFQETILDVARSSVVVEAALRDIGPPSSARPEDRDNWPPASAVEELQRAISVSAPEGAEFGQTEVIYLAAKGPSPEAAVARTSAICGQLEKHLAHLRNARAASLINEVQQTVKLAEDDLNAATSRLTEMESEVGEDLGELRSLNEAGAADSNLRRSLSELNTEIRRATATVEAQQQQRELLSRAKQDPNELLATPSQLLELQPALRRLKEGVVDAQLHTASLRGKMNAGHPVLVEAIRAEDEARQKLRAELDTALKGLDLDVEVSQRQVSSLRRQQAGLQQRLDRLATMRAQYANLIDDVRQRTQVVERAKVALADARASQTGAQTASLITRFHAPQVSDDPLGPGATTIAAAGLFGGLLTGLGLVFLVAPIGPDRGRRWSDLLPFGRRSSDQEQTAGRRAGEPRVQPTASADTRGRRADDQSEAGERRQQRRRAEDRSDG